MFMKDDHFFNLTEFFKMLLSCEIYFSLLLFGMLTGRSYD